MDRNSTYIDINIIINKSPSFIFVIFMIFFELTMASYANSNKEYYRADNFGYIILYKNNNNMDIYKYVSKEKDTLRNIANCKATYLNENSLTITSQQPYKSDHLIVDVSTKEEDSPDSISISIVIPKNIADRYYISVEPIMKKNENFQFSNNGIANFKLEKHSLNIYNQFSLCIYPKVNPFYNYLSWGDSQTLSFLSIDIEKYIDIGNENLSEVKINLLNFSDKIFQKWVIIEDIVLIKDSQMFWRDFIFTKINQTSTYLESYMTSK